MSRIGVKPVVVPSGVDVKIDGGTLNVKGPKGALGVKIADGITFEVADGNCRVALGDSPKLQAHHGLMRALLANMVTGVTAGFGSRLRALATRLMSAVARLV